MEFNLKKLLKEARAEKAQYLENLATAVCNNSVKSKGGNSAIQDELEKIKDELKAEIVPDDDDFSKIKLLVQKKLGGGGSKAMGSTRRR